ncbi:hypothetical protein JZO76_00165 [Enterococcus sp. MJM12]|uniref:PRC-barrel domain-containing protein n=1 Tax=Candidatus Enterococcus myersii TaxID=2815322 RepID=A0ABS3H3A5_9ENTE|nr:hypothetical protein [Enterococcus sp. MJM12]MBO0447942.1 hypothetical protein [Enterococcus sp. MJM12]DAY50716.1 MAG TPA: hypothetical protein [Caudoviricetes sp.]
MKLSLYDVVRLKDGRIGDITDISPTSLQIDIQVGPEEFVTDYDVDPKEVIEVISKGKL